MCLNPVLTDGNAFACRSCDECIETRLNTWVVRALAESAVAGHTYAITMTYADLPSGERPIGAIAFNYPDVQGFLKRLRIAYFRHYGKAGEIRYIACGEQGSKGTQRVHWHVILFSDRDIRPAMKWVDFRTQKPVAPYDVGTDINYNTDAWPHGHILLQKPDRKGIRYALKYALKAQMGIAKSAGTKRLPKAENWAASLFRMSKKPPIGMRFLLEKVNEADQGNFVWPTLKIPVPTSDGYWLLGNYFAEYWLGQMFRINERIRRETGRDAHTWPSLLLEVEERDTKAGTATLSEIMLYGPPLRSGEIPAGGAVHGPEAARAALEEFIHRRRDGLQRDAAAKATADRRRTVVTNCGGVKPCLRCRRGLGEAKLDEARAWVRSVLREAWAGADQLTRSGFSGASDPRWAVYYDARFWRRNPRPNPFCLAGEAVGVRDAFAYEQERERAHRVLVRDFARHGFKGKAPGVAGGRADRPGDR